MKNTNKRGTKILVIRLSAMGDVAMTVPVLSSLTETHPELRVKTISQRQFAPFFTILGLDFVGINLKDYDGFFGIFRLFKMLRKEKFDIVIDLHDVIRSNILRIFFRRIAKAEVFVIDKGRKEKKAITRKRKKILRPLRTTIERYADVFRKAGFDIDFTFKNVFKAGYELSDRVITYLEGTDYKKIGIAPFAAHQGKIYPIDRMEEVIKYLCDKGYNLFLFGAGAKEKNILQEWESKYPKCTSLCGKLSIEEELQLMNRLDLMVSMDSANMHLASLTDTPVVSIWGATHPYAGFTGWRQSPDNAVQAELFCRPCSIYGNKKCYRKDKPYACMSLISPGMIVDKIITVLSEE